MSARMHFPNGNISALRIWTFARTYVWRVWQ